MTTAASYNPVFFSAGRVVHLLDEQTGRTLCNLPGGRTAWMVVVDVQVRNGCQRCIATARGGAS